MPYLVDIDRDRVYEWHEDAATVGRKSENTIQIRRSGISRFHCRIENTDGSFYLIELGSSNGVGLNGKRLSPHERTLLSDRDVIHLGRNAFRFEILADDHVVDEEEHDSSWVIRGKGESVKAATHSVGEEENSTGMAEESRKGEGVDSEDASGAEITDPVAGGVEDEDAAEPGAEARTGEPPSEAELRYAVDEEDEDSTEVVPKSVERKTTEAAGKSLFPRREPPTTPARDENRIGQYNIERLLGEGGMGKVFEALQDRLNRRVALKVLSDELSKDEVYIARFEREAQAAAVLNHPNIVTVYEIGEDNGEHYFSMEFVDGQSLGAQLERDGVLEPDEALDFLIQATQGLAHAWEHQIIHRDIKPDNLMVATNGILKIADLGLAKSVEEVSGLTSRTLLLGTIYYSSSEQLKNASDVDCRADIYSLGATFYHLLTGQVPFTGQTPADVAINIATKPVQPLLELSPHVPNGMAAILEKMLRPDAKDQIRAPLDLLDDLEELQEELYPEYKKRRRPKSVQTPDIQTPAGTLTGAETSALSNPPVTPQRRALSLLLPFLLVVAAIGAVSLVVYLASLINPVSEDAPRATFLEAEMLLDEGKWKECMDKISELRDSYASSEFVAENEAKIDTLWERAAKWDAAETSPVPQRPVDEE